MKSRNHPDAQVYNIKPLEVATLLVNLHQAAQHPLIGHGDHIQSLRDITERIDRGTVQIKKTDLEAALWSCNMLDELGEMWTPYMDIPNYKNYAFKRLVERVELPYGYRFDRFYNVIEDKRRIRNGRDDT